MPGNFCACPKVIFTSDDHDIQIVKEVRNPMLASAGTPGSGRIDKATVPHFISTPLNNHLLLR
jgi:hypothetical protein